MAALLFLLEKPSFSLQALCDSMMWLFALSPRDGILQMQPSAGLSLTLCASSTLLCDVEVLAEGMTEWQLWVDMPAMQ